MHEFGDIDHDHPDIEPSDAVYKLDNVTLTTIGVDIGSATFHLMLSRIHLCRDARRLSSRYEVVSRQVLWRSGIGLTPYKGHRIDANAVAEFVAQCHSKAGLQPNAIDSGAVILTGEALRKDNARALGEEIALGSGKFVCVSAGHHLEAMLSAYGSGATAYSKRTGKRLLHIDIGGGTAKLSQIEDGTVQATAAVMVGGRQIAWNTDREVISTSAGAQVIAQSAGVAVKKGSIITKLDEDRFVKEQADVIIGLANGELSPLERRLRLTRTLPKLFEPEEVTFSGGVSESIYGRDTDEHGDLRHALGSALRKHIAESSIPYPVADPGEGIRATVVGVSQCSVQLSGNTVTVWDSDVLPIHNVPVIHPDADELVSEEVIDTDRVTKAINQALAQHDRMANEPFALAFSWSGPPAYRRMASFVQGIQQAVDVDTESPVIVLMDADVGESIGRLLVTEFSITRPVVCLDGLDVAPLDFVDVGSPLEPSGALAVVIKSLLFDSDE